MFDRKLFVMAKFGIGFCWVLWSAGCAPAKTMATSGPSVVNATGLTDGASGPKATLEGLCLNHLEGSYGAIGKIDGHNNFIRLNIICLDERTALSMMAEHMGEAPGSDVFLRYNFNYVSLDESRLVLSSTPTDATDRPTIPSNASFTWLTIDTNKITSSGFSADFMTTNNAVAIPLTFRRDPSVVIPVLRPAGGTFPAESVQGTYLAGKSAFGPLTLDLSIFDNVPYLSLRIQATGAAQHMVWGPAWDENTGLISSAGVAGDMTAGATPLFYIRGRMLNGRQIQFYIVNSNGVYGPYVATKLENGGIVAT